MADFWTVLLHHPISRGAVAGLVAAAVVDFHAFMTWKQFDDLKQYDWGTALFRWFQGAITGAMTGAGFTAVS
jgi:hypothetical protein